MDPNFNPFNTTHATQGTHVTAREKYNIQAAIREVLVTWGCPAPTFIAEKLTDIVVKILAGTDKEQKVIDMTTKHNRQQYQDHKRGPWADSQRAAQAHTVNQHMQDFLNKEYIKRKRKYGF